MTDESAGGPQVIDAIPTSSAAGTRTERQELAVPIGIAVYAIVVRLIVLRATHCTAEDYLITLRYAENLANGHGFVYNIGERVLGTTTPLYTLILALADLLHFDPTAVGKGLNILAAGAACYVIAQLGAAIRRPRESWFAALLFAATSAPINFSISGMETGLVTLAGLAATHSYVTKKSAPFWISCSLLFLIRIDGVLLVLVLFIGWLWAYREIPRRGVLPAALLASSWLAYSWIYFGSPIPASATAKLVVYSHSIQGLLSNWPEFKTQFLSGAPQIVFLIGFAAGAATVWRANRILQAPITWLVIYYAAMLFTKVPAFGWYFVPPMPIYYLVSAFGLARICRNIVPVPVQLRTPNLAIALLLLFALPLTWRIRTIVRDISAAQRVEDEVRMPIGLWLRDRAQPGDRIMLEPIGYIGYYSRLRVLDDIGLVSPEVLRFYRSGSRYPLVEMARALKPDLILLRAGERDQFSAYELATGMNPFAGYEFLRAWPDEVSGPMFFLYRAKARQVSIRGR